MISIKETTDAVLLATLNEEVQVVHNTLCPEIFKPFAKEEIAKSFAKLLSGREAKAFVAYSGEQQAGYAIVFTSRFKENAFQHARSAMQIDQLAVLSAFRKQGVGKALLEHIETHARTEKVSRLDLNHWTKNDEARTFFAKSGFGYYNEKMCRDVK